MMKSAETLCQNTLKHSLKIKLAVFTP